MIRSEHRQETNFSTATLDWENLYWEWMPRIHRFFSYRLNDKELAQDLTSTTFIKAWRARHQYRDDLGAFETWLFTIARNVAHDHLRQSQRRKEIPLEAIWSLSSEITVEGEAQKRRDFAHLALILQSLSQREQEIIALKYAANMTNRTIALTLSLTESNVGTILYRALQKLRRHWE